MHRAPCILAAVILAALTLAAACGESNPTSAGEKDGGGGSDAQGSPVDAGTDADAGRPDAGTSPDAGGGARETCAQYVRCVAGTNPGALGLTADQYGSEGTCWETTEDLCDVACATGLRQSRAAFPEEPACPACVADRHCGDSSAPACGPAGACVACTRDEHCPAVCDPSANTCVECLADKDCGAATPFCLPSEKRCAACMSDENCTAPMPGCSPGTNRCVECTAPAHCASDICKGEACCDPQTCEQLAQIYGCTLYGFKACGVISESRCNTKVDCGTAHCTSLCDTFCCE